WLEVAMDDPAVVGGLDDLGDALEERHELLEREGPTLAQPAIERGALHHLHRDPEQAVVMLDAERIDVGRVGMIEPRRELRFAHEALQHNIVAAEALVKHLDDGFATEQRLLAPVHRAESALVDSLTKYELADHPSAEIFAFPHPDLRYHREPAEISGTNDHCIGDVSAVLHESDVRQCG